GRQRATRGGGGGSLRVGGAARAGVRLLRRPRADRARERGLRGRARGGRQLRPYPSRGPPEVLRAGVLRGGDRSSDRARGDQRGVDADTGGGRLRAIPRARVGVGRLL